MKSKETFNILIESASKVFFGSVYIPLSILAISAAYVSVLAEEMFDDQRDS